MTVQRQIDQLLTQRASEWLETLKNPSAQARADFVSWVTESPRHLAEFLSLVALDRELPGIGLRDRFDRHALLAQIAAPVAHMSPASVTPSPIGARHSRRYRWAAGLAAGVLVCALSFNLLRGSFTQGQHFETTAGEQRSVQLADGSMVHINAQSAVHVRFNEHSREIDLLHGEALFKVARDTERAFRVHAGNTTVQALGTQFNIYTRAEGTTVSVLEGKVQVSTDTPHASLAPLDAGEAARIDPAGTIARETQADVTRSVAWRQRRLIFDKTPLEEVVQEFNRYNTAPRLRLMGIGKHSRHYSGDFDANDPESLADFLAKESDLSIEHGAREIVIRARGRPGEH